MKVHLRKIKNECDEMNFFFPNAPYRISTTSKSYSWWTEDDRTSYINHISSFLDNKKCENENIKIDAIIGHSQGGAAAINMLLQKSNIYIHNNNHNNINIDDSISLFVLFGSFPPREAGIHINDIIEEELEDKDDNNTIITNINANTNINTINTKFNIPSIHIIGEKDDVVLPIYSKAAANMFIEPVICPHDGAHDIPTCDRTTHIIVKALKKLKAEEDKNKRNLKMKVEMEMAMGG